MLDNGIVRYILITAAFVLFTVHFTPGSHPTAPDAAQAVKLAASSTAATNQH